MTTPTFRLFVSSTFSDMKAEREILQARVFPKLRDYCKSKGAMFQAVDLRWGISEEAGLDQQTMNICLRELKRCQETTDKPNFLVLLGDRYGWLPLPPQIDALEFEELEKVLTTESTEDTERLKRWYRRDDNAVPAQYVLLPREGVFEEFGNWDRKEKAVRKMFLRALETAGWPATDPRREKYEHSATHQEIDSGALALPDPEDRVLACFRTITNLPEASDIFSNHHPDGTRDEKARQQLNDLRSELEDLIPQSHRYSYEAESLCASAPLRENLHFDQDAFTDWVEESLRKIIDREIEEKQASAADPLDQENAEHEAFGRERAHRFVGRKDLLDQIGAYMRSTDSGQTPFVVHGVSGTGKTALMAKAVLSPRHADQSAIHDPQSTILLARFIGATPGSSNLRSLLVDLCQQLHRALDFEALKAAELEGLGVASGEEAQKQRESIEGKYGIPDDLNKLIEHFRGLPARVPEVRRLALVLDALDQLDDEGHPHTLAWLPDRLPGNVRVVISVLDRPGEPAGRAAKSARLRLPDALHEIKPLSTGDAGDLFDGWLADAGRALQSAQRQSVLQGFSECGLPLWLKLVSEEAKTWHAWLEPEDLPVTIPALLDHFLGELEEPGRHGHELVSTALGYLAAARNGLADEELLDVVALDKDFWTHFTATARQEHQIPERRLPPVLWARLHGDLAFALAQRHADNATLHTFYHRQIAETATRRYLDTRSRELHSRLGDYFNAQPHYHEGKPNLRKLSELVPQWTAGERWNELIGDERNVGPLSDLLFIQAKCEAGRVHELVADYNAALVALPEFREENEWLAKRDAVMIAYNRALREYAVIRYNWLQAKERGELWPEPPYPPLPRELDDPECWTIPEEKSTRAACLRHLANFVSLHIAALEQYPEDCLMLASNWAKGFISEQGREKLQHGAYTWLKREPCPLSAPLRPQCLRSFNGHKSWVRSVNVYGNGNRIISAGDDGTIRLWNLDTGACLRTLECHCNDLWNVCLFPDELCAISAGVDGVLRLWNLESGACLRTFTGHQGNVFSVSICPDGRRAISASADTTLRIWDLQSGNCLHILKGHEDSVWSVTACPDGHHAISASQDKTIRLWSLDTGECLQILEGHTSNVTSVSVCPDGLHAISGGRENTLRLWNLESGKCLRIFEDGIGRKLGVVTSPDGRYFISTNSNRFLKLWNLDDGECLRTLEDLEGEVWCVSASPDGRRAISAGSDGVIRLWDLRAVEPLRNQEGDKDRIDTIVVSQDSRRAASICWGSLRLWDIESGKCLRAVVGYAPKGGVYELTSVWLSADGRRAISGGKDGILRVWDLENGECLHALEGHLSQIACVRVSDDFRRAVSGGSDGTMRVWNLESGTCMRTIKCHEGGVNIVSVRPDFRSAISGGYEENLRLWDLNTGNCLQTLEGRSTKRSINHVTPDECNVLFAGIDRGIDLWNINTGVHLRTLDDHRRGILHVDMSPDGRRAVTVDFNSTIRIWNLRSGVCLYSIECHCSDIKSVTVSPDFRSAITTSRAKRLQLWNLENGECLVNYYAYSRVTAVSFSPAGDRIVIGTSTGQMHFLTPVNFPPSGPTIVTARNQRSVLCPCCACKFPPAPDVTVSILAHTATLLPNQSPCLDLPDSAFDDPRLLTHCPHCAKPLKFNPFFVDRG